jgi:hypothetical protein
MNACNNELQCWVQLESNTQLLGGPLMRPWTSWQGLIWLHCGVLLEKKKLCFCIVMKTAVIAKVCYTLIDA